MSDVAVAAAPQPEAPAHPWSPGLRIVFRFVCCYWVLYAMPESGRASVFDAIPWSEFVTRYYQRMWHAIVPWVATHVFHVTGHSATYFLTGSGDTTLQYVHNLLYLVVAVAGALIWSVLDSRRMEYRTLHGWLRLLVRYTLAVTLFAYGFAKVFPLQFRPPYFTKLIEPYGEFSPMGALWWFMGASIPYIIFSGAAEVLGGLLLLFRRTTSLGALVTVAVIGNVVALNYCYDVPVKLYSTNILLMAVFLLAPDLRRLLNVLVLNRIAAPADLAAPTFQRRRLRIAAVVFWVLFAGSNLVEHIVSGWKAYRETYVKPSRPPLYGLYDVENAPGDWHKVAIQFPQGLTVRTNDDRVQNIAMEYGSDNTVTLDKKEKLRWSRPDPDHLLLEGNGKRILLRRIDSSKFLLLSRGFHWINEYPVNR